MKKETSTFCIYPWDHMATLTNGHIVPCCVASDDGSMSLHQMSFEQAWNSPTMKDIRKKMMKGEKVKACERCYIEEASGIDSHRVQSNRHHQTAFGAFDALFELTDSDGTYRGPIKSVDLRLGNNCNLKCVMCRPAESSKWAGEINKMIENSDDGTLKKDFQWKSKINKADYLWHKNPEFWASFQKMVPDVREMIIGGGEPFLIPEQIAFLKECVRRGHAKHLKIRYHTNGTVLPDDVLETLTHFRHIEMMVSIDGYGPQNHYMRYPATWEHILENLKKLDNTPDNVTVYILSTMHAMSIFYFPDFLRWYMAQSFKKVAKASSNGNLPATGIVHNPSYINPQVLPDAVKRLVRARYEEMYSKDFGLYFGDDLELRDRAVQRLNANLDYMDAASAVKEMPQFKSYARSLDLTRKTSFAETFPELSSELGFI